MLMPIFLFTFSYFSKEVKRLKRDIESLEEELQSFYEKDKSAITPRTTPRSKTTQRRPG